MLQNAGYESGCPELPVVSGPCSCSLHQHRLADGASRSQGTGTFPALLLCLRDSAISVAARALCVADRAPAARLHACVVVA